MFHYGEMIEPLFNQETNYPIRIKDEVRTASMLVSNHTAKQLANKNK